MARPRMKIKAGLYLGNTSPGLSLEFHGNPGPILLAVGGHVRPEVKHNRVYLRKVHEKPASPIGPKQTAKEKEDKVPVQVLGAAFDLGRYPWLANAGPSFKLVECPWDVEADGTVYFTLPEPSERVEPKRILRGGAKVQWETRRVMVELPEGKTDCYDVPVEALAVFLGKHGKPVE